jgi:hypothetical protein
MHCVRAPESSKLARLIATGLAVALALFSQAASAQIGEPIPGCVARVLSSILPHKHRPSVDLVEADRAHLLGAGEVLHHQTFEQEVDYVVAHVDGISRVQAEYLLKSAFAIPRTIGQGVTVVIGGSRIRGNFKPGSDLDVGFSGVSMNRATSIIQRANERFKRGEFALRLENTRIVDGNETKEIPLIHSPEEFFMRRGQRSFRDGAGQIEFYPSGSISLSSGGDILFIPPP